VGCKDVQFIGSSMVHHFLMDIIIYHAYFSHISHVSLVAELAKICKNHEKIMKKCGPFEASPTFQRSFL